MFVIFSTMFNFLISPFFILALSCLLPFLVLLNPKRRWARNILLGAPLLVMFVLTSPLGRLLTHRIETQIPPLSREQFDLTIKLDSTRPVAIVVHSGGVAHYQKELEQFKFFSDFGRFATPFIWGKSYPQIHYIFSFGLSDYPGKAFLNEGPAMAKFAQDFGLDQSRIHITKPSRNTFEETQAVKEILRGINPRLTYVSSSALHLPRVMKIYAKQEIPARPFPALNYTIPLSGKQLFFNMSNAELLRQSLHELIGELAYKLTGKI